MTKKTIKKREAKVEEVKSVEERNKINVRRFTESILFGKKEKNEI